MHRQILKTEHFDKYFAFTYTLPSLYTFKYFAFTLRQVKKKRVKLI